MMTCPTHESDTRKELLKRNIFFRNLDDEILGVIAGKLVAQEFKGREFIWHEGAQSDALMLIMDGYVKIIKHSECGKDILLELLGPGDVIGAVALLEGRPYPASACALDNTKLFTLRSDQFLDIVANNPQVAVQALVALGARLRRAHEMMRQLAVESVEARISNVLLLLALDSTDDKSGRVVIPIKLAFKDIAEMVGTALETTIRIFSRWKKAGIVLRDQKYIVITDIAALKDIAAE